MPDGSSTTTLISCSRDVTRLQGDRCLLPPIGVAPSVCLAAFGFGYLLGSIPFGLILTKLAGLGDVREIGSGNIGATNVLRAGSKPLAAATLLLDAAKGTAAVLLAAHWGETPAMLAGLGAFLGHLFPVWLGFRGGKGVATFIGVLLGLYWPGGARLLRGLAHHRLRHALFIARGACRERGERRCCSR